MVQNGLPLSADDVVKHGQLVLPLPKFTGLNHPSAEVCE
jgi:hypothetical protein